MRIGIDTHYISSGQATGNATYTRELVQALISIDRENEYILYSTRAHPFYAQFRSNPQVRVRPVLSTRGLVRNYFSIPFAVAQDRPDVVHLQFFRPLFLRAAALLTIHDLYYVQMPHAKLYEKALGQLTVWSAQRASHIVTDSEFSRRDILKRCSVPEGRVSVVPAAASKRFRHETDSATIAAMRQKYGIQRDYILFVGRTDDPRKNISALLEAYFVLRSNADITYQLVIAGRQGTGTATLRERIKSAGFEEDILLLGIVFDDELPTLISDAKLFVYVSSFEGFGLPILEAMASATPVITSNVTSLPEIAGDAALMVTPGNSEELANAMRGVLSDLDLQRHMRECGLNRASLYSWERTARETIALYQKAVLA